MATQRLSKDHIEALEKILGVKLPAEGFALEIRPITADDEVDDQALDGVVGGVRKATATPAAANVQQVKKAAPQGLDVNKWLAKI